MNNNPVTKKPEAYEVMNSARRRSSAKYKLPRFHDRVYMEPDCPTTPIQKTKAKKRQKNSDEMILYKEQENEMYEASDLESCPSPTDKTDCVELIEHAI